MHLRPLLAPAFAVLAISAPAFAENAISGVDVVSLRDSGRTIGGDKSISTEWKGRQWIFSNEANRATFESNPRAYAPGFGGNCPVALSDGKRVTGSPKYPVIVGGTLYLTGSAKAQAEMEHDPDNFLGRAAKAWAKLKP